MNAAAFLSPDEWLETSGGPRYVRLRQRLEQGIEDGVLPPNSSLPPEREIADITGLCDNTVNEYFASARRKLGASNRTQAVVRAITLGLIVP